MMRIRSRRAAKRSWMGRNFRNTQRPSKELRVKKEESRKGRSKVDSRFVFGPLQDSDEDCCEFITLLTRGGQFFLSHDSTVDEKFKPVCGFFRFPQRITAFGDELGLASCAV